MWLDGQYFTFHLFYRPDYFKFAVHFGVFLGLVVGFVACFLSQSTLLRTGAALLLVTTVGMQASYKVVTGKGFDYEAASLFVNSTGAVADTIAMYGSMCLPYLAAIVLGVILLQVYLKRAAGCFTHPYAVVALCFVVLMAAKTWYSGENSLDSYPTPFRVPNMLAFIALSGHHVTREAPVLSPTEEPMIDHVAVIIDESVTGSHLALNGYGRDTTPYLSSVGTSLLNLGIASSGTNNSFGSHNILFSGIRDTELPDREGVIWRSPTMIQYAAAAQYDALVLDTQAYSKLVTNMDVPGPVYEQIPRRVPREMRDRAAADRLVDRVRDLPQTLTYLIKVGSHFPYKGLYPSERARFLPELKSSVWSGDLEEVRNSYDNSIYWGVDEFFEYLIPRLQSLGESVLIIYTSDHGEALPGTIPGTSETHGRTGMPPITANVPMIVIGIGGGEALADTLRRNESLANNTSHFEIFPTVLVLLGYDREDVGARYGKSFFEVMHSDRRREYLEGVITNPRRGRMAVFTD
jgi:lipid A ethanolaminephosphotransferase